MRVAVLGGGLLGVCTALELARRGVAVDLFDQNERLLDQTAVRNEGKIHLGFVYANAAFATAAGMLEGGLRFFPLLRRWIGTAVDHLPISDAFSYIVHCDSLLTPDQFRAHADRVASCLAERGPRLDYPGGAPAAVVRALTRAEVAAHFDEALVAAVIRTPERSIAPGALAAVLREAVAAEPRIRARLRVRVTGAAIVKGGIALDGQAEGARLRETYPRVVNALWDGRLALDARLDLQPSAAWLWRLKFAIFATAPPPAPAVPTFTAVLGPFGDAVNFGDGRLYVSWYPVCLGGLAMGLEPPSWPRDPAPDRARELFERSVAELSRLAPALAGLSAAGLRDLQVGGGIIFAHGQTDIDDRASGLHRRDRVGITSRGGWHSVDPGKYSLAPAFAYDVAERICPQE